MEMEKSSKSKDLTVATYEMEKWKKPKEEATGQQWKRKLMRKRTKFENEQDDWQILEFCARAEARKNVGWSCPT